jgi:NAD(P) transhydrogenase subunit alpha
VDSPRSCAGVPRERLGEARVAIVPGVVPKLRQAGLDILIESGAGLAAGFSDEEYVEHGAEIGTREAAFAADIVVQVRTCGASPLTSQELDRLRPDQVVVGIADALASPREIDRAASRKPLVFALDLLPRISRAQAMDVLSSQATVVGYKAVVIAAERLPKMFPMLTTAAGTVPPAQVFVIGAGVAGLTAIATARRLGAVVQAYDVRPAAQEDIESLGARALLLPLSPGDAEDSSGYARELGEAFYRRQQDLLAQAVVGVDVVISTALIPGKKAPILITAEAVERMQPGCVIVDCAAERGGNCELTRPNRRVKTENHVTILGPTNIASTVPHEASLMYAKNVTAFLLNMMEDGKLEIDLEDEIVRATLVTRGGEIVHKGVLEALAEAQHDEGTA